MRDKGKLFTDIGRTTEQTRELYRGILEGLGVNRQVWVHPLEAGAESKLMSVSDVLTDIWEGPVTYTRREK